MLVDIFMCLLLRRVLVWCDIARLLSWHLYWTKTKTKIFTLAVVIETIWHPLGEARVGLGHPSSPVVHLLHHLFPLFTFPFLSLALPIFFFCPSLPFLPE